MRLLLIILLCLFAPLYFTALQASDRVLRKPVYIAYSESDADSERGVWGSDYSESGDSDMYDHVLLAQKEKRASPFVQSRYSTQTYGRSQLRVRAEQKDESLFGHMFGDVTIKRLAKFVLFANSVIANLLAVHKAIFEFILHPVSQITETGARTLRDLFSAYYPYINQCSQVYSAYEKADLTTEVGSGMHAFHTHRTHHVKSALHQHFGIKVHDSSVPKIACAISGGGMRGCLSAAGFLAGAEQTGLLDCVMYTAAISGGSWAVGSASYLFANSHPRVTFTDYKNTLVKNLDKGVLLEGETDYSPPYIEYPASNGISRNFFRRVAWDQPITSIELWGALIANITLQGVDGWDQSKDGQRFDVKFSDIAVALQQGILPLPMLATVIPLNSEDSSQEFAWMAFTPLRAGTKSVGGYLPMWAMGRSYIEGQNDLTYKGFAGEYSLSYLLGVCEPSKNVNLKYFSKMGKPVFEVQGVKIPMLFDLADIADLRLYPYKIQNFAKDLRRSPLLGEEFMVMMDASSCLNVPLPLVTKPEDTIAQIIFIVDSDLDVVNASETSETLDKINRYYKEKNPGIMPELDSGVAFKMYKEGKVFHIFNDPRDEKHDHNLPVIVYFPLIRNVNYSQTFDPAGFALMIHSDVEVLPRGHNYLSTFNFKYTQVQAQAVADLMECNVKQSIPEIKNMLQVYMKYHQKDEKQVLDPKYKDKKPGVSFDFGM